MKAAAASYSSVRDVRGLSLVELIIAMALGVLLAGGTVGVYLASKRQYLIDDQLARMQENGRYANRLVSRELAMSGFFGGLLSTGALAPVSVGVDCNSMHWALDSEPPFDLVNDHSGGGVPITQAMIPLTCVNGSTVVPRSDLLAVKRTATAASLLRGVPLTGLTHSAVERWYLKLHSADVPVWEKLRPAGLSSAAGGNSSLSYWEARAKVLYLRSYSQYPGDDIPTLCMEVLAGNEMMSRCFVEGVEDMQFEVGVDLSGDGVVDTYLGEPSAADMKRAVIVRLHLLLRSLRTLPGYVNHKSYYLGAVEIPARHDGFLRRVFTTSVRLQNLHSADHLTASQ